MSTADRSMTPSDRRLRQAAAWRIRLQYAVFTTRLHERWEAWIDVPENQHAFAEIEALWGTLYDRCILRKRHNEQLDVARKLPARLMPLLRDMTLSICVPPRRAVLITATMAVLAIGAVVLVSNVAPATTLLQMQVHSPQREPLEPANTVESSPLTEIEVEMARGKAVFRGADDPRRRYIVTTDLARIEGTGTEFSVSNTEQSVIVTVSAGTVEISPRASGNGPTGAAITLRKDQQLILPKNGSASTVQKIAAHAERGWLPDRPWL